MSLEGREGGRGRREILRREGGGRGGEVRGGEERGGEGRGCEGRGGIGEGGREEGGEGGRGGMTVIHIIMMDHNVYITMTSRIT